ncbi:hypothetical protein [Halomonas sp. PGE1]|uniref:hypothetical protein n=1 Tax=Halomonas sp. PGE1 TaxID=2730360 RepID=UPI001474AE75|nr:hypothetical protein [Halomonas sp. PGE1]QJQ99359.1 hypothetical protein HIR79_12095 [Halomonas sp. PGE1]
MLSVRVAYSWALLFLYFYIFSVVARVYAGFDLVALSLLLVFISLALTSCSILLSTFKGGLQVVNSHAFALFFLWLLGFAFYVVTSGFWYHASPFYPLIMVVSIFSGLVLSRLGNEKIFSVFRLFYFLILLPLAVAIFTSFVVGKDLQIIHPQNRNSLSAAVVFAQLAYSFSYCRLYRVVPTITPFLSVLICIGLYGRSGILVSVVILVFTLLFQFGRSLKFKIFLGMAIPIMLIVFVSMYSDVSTYLADNTNFSRGLDSPRNLKNFEYLSSMNFLHFIVGGDLALSPTIVFYGMNPHNSLVLGHALLGIPYFFMISYVFVVLLRKRAIVSFIFCSIFILRAFFDTVALPGIYDAIFFYMFFSFEKMKIPRLMITTVTDRRDGMPDVNGHQN